MNTMYVGFAIAVVAGISCWYLKNKKSVAEEIYQPRTEMPPTGNLEKILKRMAAATNVHIIHHYNLPFCPVISCFNDIMIVQHNGGEGDWVQNVTYKEAAVPLSPSERQELNFKINKIRRDNQARTQIRDEQILQAL